VGRYLGTIKEDIDDPLLQLAGTLECDVSDIAERHDDYIGTAILVWKSRATRGERYKNMTKKIIELSPTSNALKLFPLTRWAMLKKS